MKLSLSLVTLVKLAGVVGLGAIGGLGACGGSVGKLTVDSPALPYQAPDISDITGIEEPDEAAGSGSAAATPAK